MKTQSNRSNFSKFLMIICALYLPITFLFISVPGYVHGQQLNAGVSLNTIITGNGFGTCLAPQLLVSSRRHSFSFGANIQSRQNNLTGIRGGYTYIIVDPMDPAELFVFYDVAFHHTALLGKHTLAMESQISPEFSSHLENVTMSAMEHHLGFGMNFYILRSLKVFWGAGAGYYHTAGNSNSDLVFHYRERRNFSVILMGGIKMNIARIR